MKKLFLFAGLTLVSGAGQSALSQALDPTFAPAAIYAPGDVYSAQQQADGKLVVSGTISRVNGTATGSLVRLNPNGTVDAAFQQNVGTALTAPGAQLLPNGQLLAVAYFGQGNPLTAGGITRNGLLRLNANGTADATFDAGTGPGGFIDRVLPLPNGQFLVVGSFGDFNGATVGSIVRLNASGTVDPTFNTAGVGGDIEIEGIAALPSGKFLINGYFATYNRNACHGLARLNADGSFDPTFTAALQTGEEAAQIAVQPDGRILVAGGIYDHLLRLMPDGSVDPSFAYSTANPFPNYLYSNFASPFALQPDGKILLASGSASGGPPPLPRVLRLNPNGTVDQTFQIGTGPNDQVRTVLLLAGGGVLVGGSFTNFNGTADRQLVRLSSSGAVDLTFQPTLQSNGSVAAVVRQADGKLVIRGNFYKSTTNPPAASPASMRMAP